MANSEWPRSVANGREAWQMAAKRGEWPRSVANDREAWQMTAKRDEVVVSVPGTCGELVQGWCAEWDKAVLVSCPIALYSRVSVRLQPDPSLDMINTPSGDYAKLRRAAQLALQYLGRPDLGMDVQVESQLPVGRGMASSTADVVGVMAGIGLALERPFSPEQLARLACQVEPSDSTMFANLTVLAYRDDGQYQELGPPPPLSLLMLDAGQPVNTLSFNAQLDTHELRELSNATQEAIELLRRGIAHHNAADIGAAAALSAEAYQAISYNPLLPRAQTWARQTGALGVARAHSGSVIGLLYPPDADLDEPAQWVADHFNGHLTQTHLTTGGARACHKP